MDETTLLKNQTFLTISDTFVYKIQFKYKEKEESLNRCFEAKACNQICYALEELLNSIRKSKPVQKIVTENFEINIKTEQWQEGYIFHFKSLDTFLNYFPEVLILEITLKDFLKKKNVASLNQASQSYKCHVDSLENQVNGQCPVLRTNVTNKTLLLATPKLISEYNRKSHSLKKKSKISEILHELEDTKNSHSKKCKKSSREQFNVNHIACELASRQEKTNECEHSIKKTSKACNSFIMQTKGDIIQQSKCNRPANISKLQRSTKQNCQTCVDFFKADQKLPGVTPNIKIFKGKQSNVNTKHNIDLFQKCLIQRTKSSAESNLEIQMNTCRRKGNVCNSWYLERKRKEQTGEILCQEKNCENYESIKKHKLCEEIPLVKNEKLRNDDSFFCAVVNPSIHCFKCNQTSQYMLSSHLKDCKPSCANHFSSNLIPVICDLLPDGQNLKSDFPPSQMYKDDVCLFKSPGLKLVNLKMLRSNSL
ncbi:hypothetical protein BgiMline_029855 [Biomphalaria glabrata]